jgi:hypothetical protein
MTRKARFSLLPIMPHVGLTLYLPGGAARQPCARTAQKVAAGGGWRSFSSTAVTGLSSGGAEGLLVPTRDIVLWGHTTLRRQSTPLFSMKPVAVCYQAPP